METADHDLIAGRRQMVGPLLFCERRDKIDRSTKLEKIFIGILKKYQQRY